jgi:hypothetical protein
MVSVYVVKSDRQKKIKKIIKPGFIIFFITIAVIFSCGKNEPVRRGPRSPEMLIADTIITTIENDHGFFFFQAPDQNPNWLVPYDYYHGEFFYRFEVLNYPSEKSFMLSLCIWTDINGNWESWNETCTRQVIISNKGIFTGNSVPSTWWVMDGPVDFSRPEDFARFGLVIWCSNYKNLSDWVPSSNSCWSDRTEILPLTLRFTVVAVPKDYEFSGWEKYVNQFNN